MKIELNGEALEVPAGTTISQLVEIADVPPNYLAVEVNQEVVPREQHGAYVIEAGDAVEVVTLVGGG